MDSSKKVSRIVHFLLLSLLGLTQPALAADSSGKAAGTATPGFSTGAAGAEKVNVDTIKEKYWARGNESELGVVQNRLYSKEFKFELATFGGLVSSDPFLSVKSAGLSLGFHFSEYWAVHAFGWRSFVAPSSAQIAFQEWSGEPRVNTNEPRAFMGAEVTASPLYGKLSLVGKKIIYYDMHISAGAGMTRTESGSFLTPFFGIGQQVYMTQWMSLRLDYRPMWYRETIKEKINPQTYGTVKGQRINWTHAVTFGATFLVGFPK